MGDTKAGPENQGMIDLGIAGYYADRLPLRLRSTVPVNSWGLHEETADPYLYRLGCTNGRVNPNLARFAADHPDCQYYPLNEPGYLGLSARQTALLTIGVQAAIEVNGKVYSPAFAQTEVARSPWSDYSTSVGPDGKTYPYAEAWARWMLEYGAPLPDAMMLHAYPAINRRPNEAACQVVAVVEKAHQLADRVGWAPRILLTETGWLDYHAGGRYGATGWGVPLAYMDSLLDTIAAGRLRVDVACWFISRSEACAIPGNTGGWPGYLVYSECDPDGTYGSGPQCPDYWFSTSQPCHIGHCEPPGALTPLGEMWSRAGG